MHLPQPKSRVQDTRHGTPLNHVTLTWVSSHAVRHTGRCTLSYPSSEPRDFTRSVVSLTFAPQTESVIKINFLFLMFYLRRLRPAVHHFSPTCACGAMEADFDPCQIREMKTCCSWRLTKLTNRTSDFTGTVWLIFNIQSVLWSYKLSCLSAHRSTAQYFSFVFLSL